MIVEITENGRCGEIFYREAGLVVPFYWEFAASPSLVIVSGPPAGSWDRDHPGATGRQEEIYRTVGAEIIRQKAPRCRCEFDLEEGWITVL
jgi:hypothetical protein